MLDLQCFVYNCTPEPLMQFGMTILSSLVLCFAHRAQGFSSSGLRLLSGARLTGVGAYLPSVVSHNSLLSVTTAQTFHSSLYCAKPPQSRPPPPPESTRKYPKASQIHVPLDKVVFAFARSSGPGGQNVNKLNTKAELRFHVDSAEWIPEEVRDRLKQYQGNKMSKDGMLIITSQETRTQTKNKADCVEKLQVMLEEAYVEPKDRQMWTGIGKKTKMIRMDSKRHRANIKSSRRVNKGDYD